MIYVVIQFSCIIYLILNAQLENLATLEYWLLAIAVVFCSLDKYQNAE
jgi:hypothetical protein